MSMIAAIQSMQKLIERKVREVSQRKSKARNIHHFTYCKLNEAITWNFPSDIWLFTLRPSASSALKHFLAPGSYQPIAKDRRAVSRPFTTLIA